jgi:hypothetical protein
MSRNPRDSNDRYRGGDSDRGRPQDSISDKKSSSNSNEGGMRGRVVSGSSSNIKIDSNTKSSELYALYNEAIKTQNKLKDEVAEFKKGIGIILLQISPTIPQGKIRSIKIYIEMYFIALM